MKKIVFSLFVLIALQVSAQKAEGKLYYKSATSEQILTQEQFDEIKAIVLSKMQVIAKNVKMNILIEDVRFAADSIINTFKFDIKISDTEDEVEVKKEKIYSFINKKLPSITLKTISNKDFNLKDLEGKPTVLNFWFTVCAPCIDEMPVLNRIKEKYAEKVNFVSITFNTKKEVDEFFKTHRFDYLKIVDAKDFIDELGISAFPKNIFIDKDGIVKRIEDGIPYIAGEEKGEMKIGHGEDFETFIQELLLPVPTP